MGNPIQGVLGCAGMIVGKLRSHYKIEHFAAASHAVMLCYCFSAGLSIALAQITVILLALLWTAFFVAHPQIIATLLSSETSKRFSKPLIAWIAISIVAALSGMLPGFSILELIKSLPYYLFPFYVLTSLSFVADKESRIKSYLIFMLLGQILASLHTVLSVGIGIELEPRTPGPVTEAGQLALQIPCLIALLFVANSKQNTSKVLLGLATCFCLLLGAWPEILFSLDAGTRGLLQLTFFSLGLIFSLCLMYPVRKQLFKLSNSVLALCFAFLLAAFVLNLKRGPWLGVCVGLSVFAIFSSRKIILLYLGVAVSSIFLLSPVRLRTLDFLKDFSISGGRETMWSLGIGLSERYPLGIGPHNAEIMQTIDPSLPWQHQHMHNNLLNVAVECGLLGLGIFIWWMWSVISIGLDVWRNSAKVSLDKAILALGASSALIAWQVAGLVEYNFGDAEVRLIAFFLMGLILALGDGVIGSKNGRLKN